MQKKRIGGRSRLLNRRVLRICFYIIVAVFFWWLGTQAYIYDWLG